MNNSGETVEVVNNCCSNENLVPLQEILDYGREESKENPLEKAIWAAGGSLTTCWVWFLMRFIFTQLTLSILLDGILSLTNKKPLFTIIDFIVENDKYKNLSSLITEQDKDKLDLKVNFRFDREYVSVCFEGYKKFIFNESAKASKRTILRHKVLTVLNYTLQFILVICVLWIIRNLIPITV
uniref:Fatty acyl-CoA reductase C-terminal domain-containing protein n=1 Tax=Glossina brevipalpis TaxID=37001 RepID=A0A1A9WDN2_9MUSC